MFSSTIHIAGKDWSNKGPSWKLNGKEKNKCTRISFRTFNSFTHSIVVEWRRGRKKCKWTAFAAKLPVDNLPG